MTKKRWIALVVVIVSVQLAFGFTSAFGVKRIGNLYPVQGVFVAYCTDTNETNPTTPADCRFTHSSPTWKTIPGATQQFTLPADEVLTSQALIFARFSGQTRCTGGPGSCVVRMLLTLPGGSTAVMKPSPAPNGIGLYFEGTSADGYEAHSVEQTYPQNVGAGTYTVTAQAAVAPKSGAPNPTFRFAGWTLTTEIAYTEYA